MQKEMLRSMYPEGTRIRLISMPDKPEARPILPGSIGSVAHIDDAGQIHMKWDNGRTLAIVPQVDQFRKLTKQELMEEQGRVAMQEMSSDMA